MTEPGLWMQWDYGDGPKVGRPLDGVVLRVAGVVAVPRRRSAVGSDDAVGGDGARSGVAGVRRRADLRADRQRADGLDRPRLRGGGPQPADRVGRPPLRADDRDLRAGRPGEQGRLGGDGPDRAGPIWSRPSTTCAAAYEDFGAARGRVRGVLRPRQHARAPGHAAGAGGDAGRGARAAAPAAGDAAHGLLRPDAQGVLAVDDLGRRRDLLGPVDAGRRARLGPQRWRRAGDRPRRRAGRAARGRAPRA